MLKLFQFPPIWGLPNASTFCLKLETYLKMNHIDYTNHYISNPQKAPKGKFPYIEHEGTIMGDSQLITQYLKTQFKSTLDDHLSDEDKAKGHMICRMLEEHFYWTIVYSRWVENWEQVKQDFFGTLSAPLKWIIPNIVRKNMIKQLYMQGLGRHSAKEIHQLGQADIQALATLFQGPYLFGDKPSSYDATVFAFLANVALTPIEGPLKKEITQYPQFKEYCQHMLTTYHE